MQKLIKVLFLVILVSCASEKPKGKTEAEVLFKEAQNLMESSRYILATEKLNQLRNKYPYSFYATPAELLLADILFEQENYVESAAAYLLFRDLHPKSNKIDYVIYRIAESYYNQVPDTFDRDLEGAVEAIKYYNELLTNYVGSGYNKNAKEKIARCKNMIRSKEQYIADFYFKTKVYKAAVWRYKDILSNFSDPKIRSHSMARIVESSVKLKDWKSCIKYANQYGPKVLESEKDIIKSSKENCIEKIN